MIAFALIVVVVGLAYGGVLFGGDTFGGDHLLVEIPSRTFLADSIASGNLPEWWPGVGLGVPFAANPDHLALYPPAWLAAALPMPWGADLLLAAHAVFAGLGAARLARRLGADAYGSVVAGGTFATCGAVSGAVMSTAAVASAAWVPWMLLVAARIAYTPDRRARLFEAAWMACAGGGALLAGGISIAIAGGLAAVALATAMAFTARVGTAVTALAGGVASLLLAAVLMVPAWSSGLLELAPTGGDTARLLGFGWPASGGAYVGIPVVMLAATGAMLINPARRAGVVLVVAGAAAALWWSPVLVPACALACAIAGVGATEIGRLCRGRGIVERLVPAVLAAVTIGVTVVQGFGDVPRRARAEIERPPEILPASVPGSYPPRMYRPKARVIARWARGTDVDDHAIAPANSATRFGIAYARGKDRAISPRLDRTWRAAAVASEAFFDLFDVAYMLVPKTVVFPSGMPVVERAPGGELALVENKLRRARAFVAPHWVWHADDVLLRGHLFAPGKGLRLGTVQLIGSGPPSPPRTGAVPSPACELTYRTPEDVRLRCDSTTGGYAVLLDAWAIGWSARVDGDSADIIRADSLVRAVAVTPGRHTITMRYATPGLGLGALLSLLALLNVIVLAAIRRRVVRT